jgi:hypothetical protein
MQTLILLSSSLLVGLWVLGAAFGMDVIRHIESRRGSLSGLPLLAPSAWQSLTA